MRAVNHAHVILSWQENLGEDEIPPEWMWPLDEELESWFDEVKESRRDRAGNRDNGRSSTVPLMQNELTRRRRRR
jgi:hypothetical protein